MVYVGPFSVTYIVKDSHEYAPIAVICLDRKAPQHYQNFPGTPDQPTVRLLSAEASPGTDRRDAVCKSGAWDPTHGERGVISEGG
jgi:hypothetical protein